MRMIWPCVAAALFAVAAFAQDTGPATDWPALARRDVDAAYHLLKDNHPGAVPEVGDRAFVTQLETAHAAALERAKAVTNQEGLAAALGEFANAMGDGHIRTRLVKPSATMTWAGIVMAKRGKDWIVASDENGTTLTGARLVSCDGQSADALAKTRLRFIADVTAEFSLINKAGALLVDEGNPFVKRPAMCRFTSGGREKSVKLAWRQISRDEFQTHYKPPFGQAGFGLRKVGAGYWIAIQGLSASAQPVIDAVKADLAGVRAAPFVVIDLRGNGGGNSDYSDQLITALWGEAFVNAAVTVGDGAGCGSVYRASAGNIAGFSNMIETYFKPKGDKGGEKSYTEAVAAMRKAMADGRALTGNPVCAAPTVSKPSLKPAITGRVFVLTDTRCFSSCLIAVDNLRQFGAEQIGRPTAFNTYYSENREITLPSGLATFATQQAIMTGSPRRVGPFEPEEVYAGDIADTAALEAWVLAELAPKK